MVKRMVGLLLAAALAALSATAAFSADLGAETRRVFDYSDLFSDSEEAQLEESIAAAREKTGMDLVVLTSDEAVYSADDGEAEKNSLAYADDFYDFNGFGAGERGDGLLYFIDMSNRMPTISTKGKAIDLVTDSRLSEMLDAALNDLADGEFADSAQTVVEHFTRYSAAGVPEGQYQYDTETGEQLTAPHKRLTAGEVLVAAGVAAVVGLVIWIVVLSSYRMKGSAYTYDLSENGQVRRTGQSDRYLTTQVSRVRKQRSSGGGGGGGSFGGGSGVHMSSSGSSHGGGSGGRF